MVRHSPVNLFLQKFNEYTVKKPRLFYYEEAVDAWVPAPDLVESIIDAESHFGEDGETFEVTFRRVDMTDEEFFNLEED